MGVGNGLAHLLENPQQMGKVIAAGLAFIEQGGKGAALHELHGEIGAIVGESANLVNGHNAGMLELGGDASFFEEADDKFGLIEVFIAKGFEGEDAIEFGIANAQDDAHAAPSDFGNDDKTSGHAGGRATDDGTLAGMRVVFAWGLEHRRRSRKTP
jgi:hypothetical protein